jgi:hypothetical protein
MQHTTSAKAPVLRRVRLVLSLRFLACVGLLSVCLLLCSASNASASYISFCYVVQNTLSTSPHLPWAVQVSGRRHC